MHCCTQEANACEIEPLFALRVELTRASLVNTTPRHHRPVLAPSGARQVGLQVVYAKQSAVRR